MATPRRAVYRLMTTVDKATRFPIHAANWAWLGLVLIATPYVASLQLGDLQVVARRTAQGLALGGLLLGCVLNGVAARLLRRKAAWRRLCWRWSFIHLGFAGAIWLVFLGVVKFDWLRDWLVGLKRQLGL